MPMLLLVLLIQVTLEATVVAQTLLLAQVTKKLKRSQMAPFFITTEKGLVNHLQPPFIL